MTASTAPTRLTIPLSAIDPQSSVTIPLQVVPMENGLAGTGDGKSPLYKVAIEVALSTPGGTPGRGTLYELDTGGKGFFAGNVAATPATLGQVADQYASGIAYVGNAALMSVSFPGSSTTASFEVVIGLVDAVTYNGQSAHFPVFKAVDGPAALFGDFGCSLQASQLSPQTATQPANAFSLLTVLAQLGPQFGTGFIVDVGPYPNGVVGKGRVIAGLTDTLRQLFPIAFAMQPAGPYTAGGQSVPATYTAQPITGALTVGSHGPVSDIPIVFDTGAPHTTLHQGSSVTEAFSPAANAQVLLTAGPHAFPILDFQAGSQKGVNEVQLVPPPPPGSGSGNYPPQGYVNTGLAPFFANPILFDLQEGMIRFPAGQA